MLNDTGPGIIDRDVGGIKFKVTSLDVVWDTGCQNATGSSRYYVLKSTSAGAVELSGTGVGGANMTGTDHFTEEPGHAYFVEFQAGCCDRCNTLGADSKGANIKSNVVVAPAWITGALLMTATPARLYKCFPTGTEVQFQPLFMGGAGPNESWRLRLKGAGLDFDQTFTADELKTKPILITAPSTGDIDFWVVHQPYAVESANHFLLKSDPAGCLGGADAGSSAGQNGGAASGGTAAPGTGEPTNKGCSASGGFLALAGAVLLVVPALRRRRARSRG